MRNVWPLYRNVKYGWPFTGHAERNNRNDPVLKVRPSKNELESRLLWNDQSRSRRERPGHPKWVCRRRKRSSCAPIARMAPSEQEGHNAHEKRWLPHEPQFYSLSQNLFLIDTAFLQCLYA
jgi:hypothetical protein